MSKIFALYTNEMIKLSRKISVWILITLMTVSSLFTPIFMKDVLVDNDYRDETSSVNKTLLTKNRDALKESLGDVSADIQHATLRLTTSDNEVLEVFGTYLTLEDQKVREYALLSSQNAVLDSYNFDAYPLEASFLAYNAMDAFVQESINLNYLNTAPFEERDSAWFEMYQAQSGLLELSKSALFDHSMASMVAYVSAQDPENRLYDLSIWQRILELDPNGNLSMAEGDRIVNALLTCENYQQNLDLGIDDSNGSYVPLSEARRTQIENSLKILEYQISHGELPDSTTEKAVTTKQFTHKLARFFLVVLMIIIAGSSISQELATGSIKSLIIAPVKRWKIFTAKLLSILTWGLLGSILITSLSTLSTMFCLGTSSLPPYYYVSGGAVKIMPHFLFTLLSFLVDNISLFIYILTAFMISCLTRNTGISVGLSSAFLLGSGVSSTLLELFGHHMWIDFLPFSNMDLLGSIFPYLSLIGYSSSEYAGLFGYADMRAIPLSFSVTYLIVLSAIMLLIAYDGFVRRDIQ